MSGFNFLLGVVCVVVVSLYLHFKIKARDNARFFRETRQVWNAETSKHYIPTVKYNSRREYEREGRLHEYINPENHMELRHVGGKYTLMATLKLIVLPLLILLIYAILTGRIDF